MDIFRGGTAIVGVGQTPYYKRGTSPDPELKLALKAIVSACEDAGVETSEIDGFVSYATEKSEGQKLMPALGCRDVRLAALTWMHGGGIPGALCIAASAILSGQANVVAVYRSMAERPGMRLRTIVQQSDRSAHYLVNGLETPVQTTALRATRLFEADGVPRSAMRAVVQASYYHARNNPRAYGRNTVLDEEAYEQARRIADPLRIFDCSRESDAGCAVILVSAERARDLAKKPAYILSAQMGGEKGAGALEENFKAFYGTAGQQRIAQRLWAQSGYRPKDVDVAQIYCSTVAPGVGAIIDHGFCTAEEAGEFITLDNLIAPSGRLPINTSGGDVAEGFIHGMGLVAEAVRQIRGESTNQVPGAKLSLMTGGPQDPLSSTALLGALETL
jgi:acetyl-CoA acetyltransferase